MPMISDTVGISSIHGGEDVNVCTRVLLAYDGTAPAQKAFDYILKLPLAQRGELAILSVIEPSAIAVDFAAQTLLENVTYVLEGRMIQLQRRAEFAGTPTTSIVRLGHPVEQIVRVALEWRADLVVTGYRDHLTLMSWIWGCVSSRVRARAPCPVVIVR